MTEKDETLIEYINMCKDIVHNVNYKISQGQPVDVVFEKKIHKHVGHESFVAKQKDRLRPNENYFQTIFEARFSHAPLTLYFFQVVDTVFHVADFVSNEGARLHNELNSYFRVMDKTNQEKREQARADRQKALCEAEYQKEQNARMLLENVLNTL